MADIFISYSQSDRAIAEELGDDLASRGFDVWMDRELRGGEDFHNRIRDELRNAKVVIVIWSEASVKSIWVRGEAQEAYDDNQKLISTHVPEFNPRQLPINFRALHVESLSNTERLLKTIEGKGIRLTALSLAIPLSKFAPQDVTKLSDLDAPSEAVVFSRPLSKRQADLESKASAGSAEAQYELAKSLGFGRRRAALDAITWLTKAALQGHAAAQFQLGHAYENGHGVVPDEAQAEIWMRRAAQQGHPGGLGRVNEFYEVLKQANLGSAEAQYKVAMQYKQKARRSDEAQELYDEFLRKAVEQGHADAQSELAHALARGTNTYHDEQEAERLYRLAAAQGNVHAERFLDRICRTRELAEDGDAESQCKLGREYEHGTLVAKSRSAAITLYRLAVDQGHADAQYRLGALQNRERRAPSDIDEVIRLFRLAAEQGHAEAQYELGLIFIEGTSVEVDEAEAEKCFRLSAEQGHSEAQCWLGQIHADGRVVQKNFEEAARLFTLASEQHEPMAMFFLGVMHMTGRGVSRDLRESARYLTQAANSGIMMAKLELADLLEAGVGTPKNSDEADRLRRDVCDEAGEANASDHWKKNVMQWANSYRLGDGLVPRNLARADALISLVEHQRLPGSDDAKF